MQLSRDGVVRGGGEAVSGVGEDAAHNLLCSIPPPMGLLWPCWGTWGFCGWPRQTQHPAPIQGLATEIVTSAGI